MCTLTIAHMDMDFRGQTVGTGVGLGAGDS